MAPKKRGWGGGSKPTTKKEPPARALESEDDDDDYMEDETIERLPRAKIEIWYYVPQTPIDGRKVTKVDS